jgi:hypothetical protein
MEMPAMEPYDACADGVVVEMLPGRRCSVRLEDGRVVVGRIPEFDTRDNEPYYPEPGHPVTVYLKKVLSDLGDDFLLVEFPLLSLRSTFLDGGGR